MNNLGGNKKQRVASDELPRLNGLNQYQQNGEKRRVKILEIAGKCFLKSGFDETTLEEIATESGVVKQTIYNYFETKDALFTAAIDHALHSFAIQLNPIWYQLTPSEFLTKVGQLQLEKLQIGTWTEFLQLAVKEARTFPEIQMRYAHAVIEPMVDFVGNYFTQKYRLGEDNARLLAWAYRSAITGYATLLNLQGLSDGKLPTKKMYLATVAELFASLLMTNDLENLLSAPINPEISSSALPELSDLKQLFARQIQTRYADNQAIILAAAVMTFSQRGFGEASMNQIAGLACVSKQTIYSRFKNKESLYREMCSQTLSRLRSNDLTPEKAKKRLLLPPHDHFHSIFKQTEKMWIRDFLHVVIAESRAFPAEANMAILFLYDFGRHAIQTYFEEQQPAGPDPASRAIALQGIVATFILLRQIYHVGESPFIIKSTILQLVALLQD